MKRLRSTLFLLVLTAFGAAYLFWNERGPAPNRGAVVLLRAPQSEVHRVVLRPSGVVFEARSPGEFRVREAKTGRSALLDEAAAGAFWKQIALVQSRLAVPKPHDLRQYGLDKPRASIEVDGRQLEFGAPAPFDKSQIYARGEGHIALVSAELAAKARQPFAQWRERRVMRGAESAETFTLNCLSDELQFRRDGVQWQLNAPQSLKKPVAADTEVVNAALNALSNARITRWLDERGQNPGRYGLGGLRVGVKWNQKRLEIGANTSGGFAARSFADGEQAPIFEVPASLEAVLNRPLGDWRDKRLARFEIDAIERLEIARPAKTRVLVRENNDWHLENASNDPKIRAAALDTLEFLHDLRARGFDETGDGDAVRALKTPFLTLKAMDSAGAVAFELRFGRAGKKLWAQNGSRNASDTIFELDAMALQPLDAVLLKISGPTP